MNDIEKIVIGDYTFTIMLTHPGEWLNNFPSSVKQLVRVYFIPMDSRLREHQVIRIFEKCETQILNHIRILIEERKSLFKDIEIKYQFHGHGFSLDRIEGQKRVIHYTTSLLTDFKEKPKRTN